LAYQIWKSGELATVMEYVLRKEKGRKRQAGFLGQE
jgi:hypothetical protein